MLNQPPIMSLKQLYTEGEVNPLLTMENVAANIMSTFEDMWRQFAEAKGSFEPFMDMYLERWLHSYVDHVGCHYPRLTCLGYL